MKSLTTWEYSLETEAKRILYTAHQIYVGFYKSNGFIVVPQNLQMLNSNTVILPNLDFNSISKFWKKVSKINIYTNPMTVDRDLLSDFKDLLSKHGLKTPTYTKTMRIWEKAEKEILDTIYDILSKKKGEIKKILINPTKFGTSCSFSYKVTNNEVVINLRDDHGIHAIGEAIITSLTRDDIYKKLDGTWQESEIVTDFLITQTKIAEIIKKYEPLDKYSPTMKNVRTKDVGKLLEVSNNYYKDLKIPNFDNPFSLNGKLPKINKKSILYLNNNEKQIMYLLIKNPNNVVSFDQVSDVIFANEEKFSLFTLAKFIQRLREKLEKNNVSGSFIQTVRGKGYLLKN